MDNKTAIGNDKTKKPGKLKKRTFKAKKRGKPYSTIFLIRSNNTPTDKEITVKAEMANIIGGIICPNNHLSIKGIEYQGVIILSMLFLKKDLFECFKRNLYCADVFPIIKYQWFGDQYKILLKKSYLGFFTL